MITTRPLTPDDWPVLERLFGPRGACGGCWCMYWRTTGAAWTAGKGAGHRATLEDLVRRGIASGVLAFVGDEPVGWCAVGPRADFARVTASRVLRRDAPADVWSLNCFYIPSARRKQGVASALLGAAVDHAFARGAREVEAYPVQPKTGGLPGAFAYTGVVAMYARAGFTPLDRPGLRPVWVRAREA